MAIKTTKRTRTWVTKSGEVRTKTYYYKVEKGGKKAGQKQSFTKIEKARTPKKMSKQEALASIEDLKSQDLTLYVQIKNELKFGDKFKGKEEISTRSFEVLIDKTKRSKQETFVRNLGYDMEEFAQAFGITEEDLMKGKFESENDGKLTKFTSPDGKVFYFSWDYDRGLTIR